MKNIIALCEPEIPSNTGNIARTCVLTGSRLELIGPLGFSLEDKYLKRAGLDYWPELDIGLWENLDAFKPYLAEKAQEGYQIIYATTHGAQTTGDLQVTGPCLLLFGKETAGLPKDFIAEHPDRCWRIPMIHHHTRSLNLSNSAAILIYEVLRQQGFPELS